MRTVLAVALFQALGASCRLYAPTTTDCSVACGLDAGECECEGGVGPAEETCDEKDDACDGLVEVGPVVQLLDNTGPPEGLWRLHGLDGGCALVTPLAEEEDSERSVSPGPSKTAAGGDAVHTAASTNDGADLELCRVCMP